MASELHVHTTFSKLDAYGLPDQLVKRALHLGLKALAITDHANTAAHPKLEMACNKWGKCKTCGKIVDMKSIEHLCENPEYHTIKPLFGVELYLNTKRQKKNHITAIAQTLEGYRNLVSLASLAYSEGYFYYMPCVNIEDVIEYQKGLVILSGCMSGIASELINDGKVKEAEEHLIYLNNSIDNFFVEIQPLDLSYGEEENKIESRYTTDHLIAMAKRNDIPMVATNDVHYITPEDRHLQHFVAMVRRKTNIKKFPDAMSERCCLASEDDFTKWLEPYGVAVTAEAIVNQDYIAHLCEDFKLPKATPMKWNDKPDEERYQEFVDLCNKGWNYRKCKGNNYKEQGKYEMSLIKEKGFYDYFLIVADMVQAAKDKNIMVGPGRGSVGGSLVSYMMRITEIDPIRFKLLFERFLDPSRTDSPDIDLDFQDDRRDEVKDYMKQKWGEDKVKNIAGYTMYHDKGLLDDIGRCYCIPPFEIDRFKKMLIIEGGDKSLEDILELISKSYKIPEGMQRMLGQLRGFTVHAAGLIVSSEPLKNITTIMGDSIALDKRDAEYLDILKIDALSLTTLRVISLALEKIGMTVEELYNLPLDIKDVYKGFKDAQMQGIFQFAGGTTKSVCRKALRDIEMDSNDINFDEVFDIVTDVNTLSRPASMNNGSTARYIENEVEEIHPWITKHTQATRGQIIYQEQIMKVLKEGGLSWEDIGAVRKLITKHEGAEKLEGIKNRFIDGLIKFGTRKDICKQVWDRIGDEGAYGFNNCLDGEEIIWKNKNQNRNYTIEEMYLIMQSRENAKKLGNADMNTKYKREGYGKTLSMCNDNKLRINEIVDIRFEGIQEVFKVTLESGKSIRCTRTHKFPTKNGEMKLDEIKIGDSLYVKGKAEKQKHIKRGRTNIQNFPNKGTKGFTNKVTTGFRSCADHSISCKGNKCERCENIGLELHHKDCNRDNNIVENYEWLCISCHKKEHYSIGRTVVYGKGIPVYEEKIINIESIGFKNTYDVEMKDPNHNFINMDGIVTSNSHCVAYTLIAYFTMYLKVTNPLVFYWANMMVDNENGDMLREFAQNGGKVLEVRFGSSLRDWSMDLEKNGLRAGYSALKGIGPKTADKLVELQESHRLPSGDVEIDVKDFTAKIFKTLDDNHAFDDDAEKHDFLGFNNLSEAGGEVDERELINEISSGVAVVLVKLSDWKVKNLREYYKKNNKDYEEVKQGHLDTYVNMKVYDESGEMALTISRYKYPTYKDIVAAYDKDKLYKIKLDFSDSKNKGYILDISVIGEEIEWDESNELSFT